MRQDRHLPLLRPVAKPRSGQCRQMLDDRGRVDLEKEILVGFIVGPTLARFFFGFRAGANRDENHAMGLGILERVPEPLA